MRQVFCIRPTRTRVGLDREKAPDPPNPPKMFFAGRFCSDLGGDRQPPPFRIPSDNQIIEKRIARAYRRADKPSYYPSPTNRSHYPTAVSQHVNSAQTPILCAERGVVMWDRVMKIVRERQSRSENAAA
jgi:hypothetical protein